MVFYRKIFLFCSLVLMAALAFGANSINELRGLKTKESRFPVYNKERLQLMIYSAETERQGELIATVNPVMDIIRKDADVDDIDSTAKTEIYPLGSPLVTVLAFWAKRLYSEGVVSSHQADIDQGHQLAAGGEPVFFRSPLLDINGVGFDADYGKKTLKVRSDVNIVLRMGGSDPRLLVKGGELPGKYEFLTAKSDSMEVDFPKGEIVLIGKVTVAEDRAKVTCDRLTIYLVQKFDDHAAGKNTPDRAAAKSKAGKNDSASPENLSDMKGVSRIVCEGNVIIDRLNQGEATPSETQRATADRVIYEISDGKITMTGLPNAQPELRRGDDAISGDRIVIHRETNRMEVVDNCKLIFVQPDRGDRKEPKKAAVPTRLTSDAMNLDYRGNCGEFTGRVRVADEAMDLECGRMQVKFREIASSKKEAAANGATLSLVPSAEEGVKRELSEIACFEKVKMVRRRDSASQPEEKALADQAVLDCLERRVTLSGKEPTLYRGDDSMTGSQLTIFLDEERLTSTPPSRVTLCAAPAETAPGKPAAKNDVKTIVTSDSSDLNYGGNVLTFAGNVKVRDPRMSLDCDKLEIFLKEDKGAAKPAKKAAGGGDALSLGNGSSAKKTIDRVVCTGKVKARDQKSKLDTDLLTLYFREMPANAKKSSSAVFQSKDTELAKITFVGNVRLETLPRDSAAKPEKADGNDKDLARANAALSSAEKPTVMTADRGEIDLMTNLSQFHGKVKVVETRATLESDSLYLKTRDVAAAEPLPPEIKSIDNDPFGTTASSVPEKISISDNKELVEVVARKNVKISRQLAEGGSQYGTGDVATYDIPKRTIVMTGTPGQLPVLQDAMRGRLSGKKITVFLANEQITTDEQGTMEITDPTLLQKIK
ncbi:MAG: LptA/OstA family protein [Victivallaceae bacterium]